MMSSINFDGTEGEYITPAEAQTMLSSYSSSLNYVLNQGVKGHLFGKDIILDLLSQTDAKGIRIYYGLKPESGQPQSPQLIIVATNSSGDDILGDDKIADASKPCPPICGTTQLPND